LIKIRKTFQALMIGHGHTRLPFSLRMKGLQKKKWRLFLPHTHFSGIHPSTTKGLRTCSTRSLTDTIERNYNSEPLLFKYKRQSHKEKKTLTKPHGI